jgi:UDP:flavonoid glycosyltransferase YjiC (YdhE family)
MKVLITPVGSAGDNYPFIGLAAELVRRGHDVHVLSIAPFGDAIAAAGAHYVEMGTMEEYRTQINNPDLWHPMKGTRTVARLIGEQVRRLREAVARLDEPGRTLVVAHTLDFASRALHEKSGLPFVAIHLQPSIVRTSYQLPTMVGTTNYSWLPRWVKRSVWWFLDHAMMDPAFGPSANEVRRGLGLPPVRRIFEQYLNSPLLTIGMWPDWFGPPQPDWPRQMKLAGFPLYDPSCSSPLDPEIDSFLRSGEAPVVFTPGSAMVHGHAFFAAAVEACQRLNRRGLLMTRHEEHLPPSLPPTVRRFAFAPFSKLLPRCAALVHHGGIGSTAAALAAGIPQVIMPMSHDQPDNTDRSLKLGVAERIVPKRFTGPNVAAALGRLLDSAGVKQRCTDLARRCRETNGIGDACDMIEGVMPRPAERSAAVAAVR